MKTITQHIRRRLLSRVHDHSVGDKRELPAKLVREQWSPEFEQLMRNRLLIGRFRYGRLHKQRSDAYDNIRSAIKRLRLYQQTGNLEHLVDAANLCLVEYVTGDHPERHFDATDDGEHVEKL